MAGLFNIPQIKKPSKRKNAELISKLAKRKVDPVVAYAPAGNSLSDKIDYAKRVLESMPHLDKMEVIRDEERLKEFIDDLLEQGIGVIDVEASSKDPMNAKLAGVVLYAPNLKSAYIPCGHVSHITLKPAKNQVSKEVIEKELRYLNDNGFKFIGHHTSYDVKNIMMQLFGLKVNIYWDTYIAQRLINENEPSNRLKDLHAKYCQTEEEDKNALKFSDVFKGIEFNLVPINVGYVYACADGFKTFELYEWQLEELSKPENKDVFWSFMNVEMEAFAEVVEMEYRGIAYDMKRSQKLQAQFEKSLKNSEDKILQMVAHYKTAIRDYNHSMGKEIIKEPFNISSPSQLSAFLFDILKLKGPKGSRKTGEEVLKELNHPIVEEILNYRGNQKMLSTFIKSIQDKVHPITGRVHTRFNQVGADTLRMSSSEPNLQNIPARKKIGKEIRQTFIASEGCVLLSSDYSAQEPRLTAHMSGDEKMIGAYNAGKDLYVEIAAIAFNKTYEECLEHNSDGTPNPEGKERRGKAKAIVLGVVYGKGIPAIAQDLNINVREAQAIYDKIMTSFPRLLTFMEDSWDMAYELGYVTTVWGQRRRLPDMQLPLYEFKRVKPPKNFDPLDFEGGGNMELTEDEIDEIWDEFDYIDGLPFKQMIEKKQAYIAQLKEDGIEVKDNQGFIARAKRQTVNARIQGSAAQQTKMAVARISKNKRLKELGFRLLLQVHDELIGEVPLENAKEASELFAMEMNQIANDWLTIPSGCDVEAFYAWGGETVKI